MKYDEFHKAVYGPDTVDGPHGWIQWKGTNVCIDLHCKCGHHGHIDADFFYYYGRTRAGLALRVLRR